MTIPSPPQAGIGSAVAKGAAWTVAFRLADRSIGLVSTLVLARLLVPEDFGVIAMATTLMALIEVVTVGEFGSAIIHNPDVTRDHYDSAWSMSALFGLTAAGLLIALAYPTASFFKEPRLVPVIFALSLLPIMDGLFNMGCVDFRKHMQFHKDFQLQVGRKLIGFLVVIPLAIVTRSYWALVAGMIAGRAARPRAVLRAAPIPATIQPALRPQPLRLFGLADAQQRTDVCQPARRTPRGRTAADSAGTRPVHDLT